MTHERRSSSHRPCTTASSAWLSATGGPCTRNCSGSSNRRLRIRRRVRDAGNQGDPYRAHQPGPARPRPGRTMRYSIHERCQHGQECPQLHRKDGSWNSRHGSAGWAARIPTSAGTRLVKRFGYTSKKAAEAAAGHAGKLLDLATDDVTRAKIGDLIAGTRRGQALPTVADVARRLGLGQDPGSPGVTFADGWAGWLAGKRKLRPSARARLEQIGEHWLLPVLADVPVERLSGAHIAEVFARIEKINAEIIAQSGGSRAWVHVEGDVRTRPRPVGTASQHRVYAALREYLNHEVRRARRLSYNPVWTVELAPEITPEAQRWSAAQARQFLAACANDPLGLLFRIVILRGARRSEAVGLRWSGADLDAGYLRVERPVLLVGADVIEGRPKSSAGERLIWLDAETVRLLREHRKAQLRQGRRVAGQRPGLLPRGRHALEAGRCQPTVQEDRQRRGPAGDQAARGQALGCQPRPGCRGRPGDLAPHPRSRRRGHDVALYPHRGRRPPGCRRGRRSAGRGGIMNECSPDVPRSLIWGVRSDCFAPPCGQTEQPLPRPAEADGNRTRRRRRAPSTGFEDRGGHQAP